jgi:hypothetical protein
VRSARRRIDSRAFGFAHPPSRSVCVPGSPDGSKDWRVAARQKILLAQESVVPGEGVRIDDPRKNIGGQRLSLPRQPNPPTACLSGIADLWIVRAVALGAHRPGMRERRIGCRILLRQVLASIHTGGSMPRSPMAIGLGMKIGAFPPYRAMRPNAGRVEARMIASPLNGAFPGSAIRHAM